MKRKPAFILAMTFGLAFALAGCNPWSGSTAHRPAEQSKYKLIMYYPGTTPKDLALVQDAINKRLTEKINAAIELKPIDWGAYNDKTNLMFTSNEKFDLMFTAAYLNFNANVAKGQFVQLDALLEKYGQGIIKTLGSNWIAGSQVNGHSYGVPTLKEFAGAAGLLFRKDLVDKYSIDLDRIHELADLTPIFRKIKENEPDVTPLVQSEGLTVPGLVAGYTMDLLGDGLGVLDPAAGNLKVVNLLETRPYTDAVKQMRNWYLEGFINEDAATLKDDQLYNIVRAGKAFAFAVTTKPGKDVEMSAQLGVELVQRDITRPQTTTGEATGAMLAISRTSADPERAMMFLDLLYTDKQLINLLDFGIEGRHYIKDSNGMLSYPEGVDSQNSTYSPGTAWMFGNQMNAYLWRNEDRDKWAKFKAFNDSSVKSPALGFMWDPTKVKNEVSAAFSVQKEFDGAIRTGTVDPDKYIPMYIEKLKAAGLGRIIAEKQKQLDAWAQSVRAPLNP
ncbi:ABC transporter substrate-binding protein [Cohnella sp. 56]|uniref:ABC transporter substrate-binding protein n=1 Tax=Cohnella sp. 56 TaxID=3113722 RepID=UPI0030E98271